MQQQLFDDLPRDRGVFPHQYEITADQILLVRLAPDILTSASFLDQRVLKPDTKGAWFAWAHMARALLADKRPDYIFHMGHCGSTLVSRLLSAATGAQALREPLPLRVLATDAAEGAGSLLGVQGLNERLSFFERCWARGDAPVIVKATSMCTGLAPHIISTGRRGLFLYQTPETHLAALLAGQNTLNDLRGFAQLRYRRLRQIYDAPPLATASLGDLAAHVWLSEAAAAAAVEDSEKLHALNFETFLQAPAENLKQICAFYDFDAADEKISAALSGPILKTYSKAPEHAFTADTRRQIIDEARRNHKVEIARGMAYIENATKQSEVLSKVVHKFSN